MDQGIEWMQLTMSCVFDCMLRGQRHNKMCVTTRDRCPCVRRVTKTLYGPRHGVMMQETMSLTMWFQVMSMSHGT